MDFGLPTGGPNPGFHLRLVGTRRAQAYRYHHATMSYVSLPDVKFVSFHEDRAVWSRNAIDVKPIPVSNNPCIPRTDGHLGWEDYCIYPQIHNDISNPPLYYACIPTETSENGLEALFLVLDRSNRRHWLPQKDACDLGRLDPRICASLVRLYKAVSDKMYDTIALHPNSNLHAPTALIDPTTKSLAMLTELPLSWRCAVIMLGQVQRNILVLFGFVRCRDFIETRYKVPRRDYERRADADCRGLFTASDEVEQVCLSMGIPCWRYDIRFSKPFAPRSTFKPYSFVPPELSTWPPLDPESLKIPEGVPTLLESLQALAQLPTEASSTRIRMIGKRKRSASPPHVQCTPIVSWPPVILFIFHSSILNISPSPR